ncbi:MAG TPA: exodeoxyribonuclease VII small subunit [Myxococcales bacterium]|nr:exodeoxyribonuclease VII small subunit [Myxococcales bacterium]
MAKDAAGKAQEELGYEQIIERLEEVVRRLEGGNLSLEESLEAFEEGIGLVRCGEARLNQAEKRVEQLLATPRGDEPVPMQPAARGAEPKRPRGRARAADEQDDDIPPF